MGSAHIRMCLQRGCRRLPLSLAAALLCLSAAAPAAHAGLTVDASYAARDVTCNKWGESDGTGIFYTTCGAAIRRYDKHGTRLGDIPVPGTVRNPADVAPSPDGTYLYLSQGTATPARLVRQANGSYSHDGAWRLPKFTYGNQAWDPIGHQLTTDGRGDIYLSNGSYWVSSTVATPGVVVKYAPDGTLLAIFGDHGVEPGQWVTNMDIAVSHDGRRVYVGENCSVQCHYDRPGYQPSRVTRYDYVPGGRYRFTRIVSAQGPMDGGAFPGCGSAGATHSAYSLAIDHWDNLYVTSTTCGRIQMFRTGADPADDRFLRTVATNLSGDNGIRIHDLSSDMSGRLYSTEWARIFDPRDPQVPQTPLAAPAPLPALDTAAPTITSVTLPEKTESQDVEVAVAATDDTAVAEMRLANEDGRWGPWQPFATPVVHRLSDGYATKGVSVQVRDMAGNTSASVYRTVRFVQPPAPPPPPPPPPPPADAAPPVLTSVAVPPFTWSRTVTVQVEASDDKGLRSMRLANEDGTWSAWRPWSTSTTWTLTAGFTGKIVSVQVTDVAGKGSKVLSARTALRREAAVGGGGTGTVGGGGTATPPAAGVRRPGAPGRPSLVRSARTFVVVRWAPARGLGSGHGSYLVQRRIAGRGPWTNFTGTAERQRSTRISRLRRGQRVQVRVRAYNRAGVAGPWSRVSMVRTRR